MVPASNPIVFATSSAVCFVRKNGEEKMSSIDSLERCALVSVTDCTPCAVRPYGSFVASFELTTPRTLLSASPWRIIKYRLPDFFVFSASSAREPSTRRSSHVAHCHTGSGAPQ